MRQTTLIALLTGILQFSILPTARAQLLINGKELKKQQVEWLRKKHFELDLYDGKNEEVNKLLILSLKKHRNARLFETVAGSFGVSSVFIAPAGLIAIPTLGLGAFSAHKANKTLRLATEIWYHELTGGQQFSGSERFRNSAHSQWLRRRNFFVEYYDGSIDQINEDLTKSYALWKTSQALIWTSTPILLTGSTILIFTILQNTIDRTLDFLFNFPRDSKPSRLSKWGLGLTFSSAITGSIGVIFKTKSERLLSKSSRHWQKELLHR